MKTIKISNLQEGDVFMYKGVMYEIVHKDKWEPIVNVSTINIH